MSTRLIPLMLTAALLTVSAPTLAGPQTAVSRAEHLTGAASRMIEQNTQRILDTLDARRAEFSQDRTALHTFVFEEFETIFDRNYSARRVLGRHGRGAEQADIALFADALTDSLLQRYGSTLLDFNTQLNIHVKSESELPRGMGVHVASELIRRGGAPIALDFLLRQTDGQWKVFDLIVEGISMVQTFQQQFDPQLQRKSIREVAAELRAGQLQVSTD